MRIPSTIVYETIKAAFVKAGMPKHKADVCARVHMESSLDGVYSHGLNRVERFINYIKDGLVDVHTEPEIIEQMGVMEIIDGHLAPGITNALFATDRAIALAAQHGIGMVGLRNTTHWMRGGTYGKYAAEKGYIAICWTNTESCMPAWGAISCGIGNNPLVMAVPNGDRPVLLDMAMSQYSYGKLQVTRLKQEQLPYAGGFDQDGKLSTDPASIEATRRILPTGYWKGSGLAILLDIIAALLSGGKSTAAVDKANLGSCGSCAQVFILIDPYRFNSKELVEQTINETIVQIKSSIPVNADQEIFFPGERTMNTRKENLEKGILVDEGVWKTISELAN